MPKQEKNYIKVPGTFVKPQCSTSSPLTIAAAEEAKQHLELDESHRTQALSGVETDTHHRRWD